MGILLIPILGNKKRKQVWFRSIIRSQQSGLYSITSSARNESGTGMPRAWPRDSEGELVLARP
jgi:hypothetical protein